ncbi:hypothetical protein C7999DRAFT_27773 [Corynascus novoguineensis]|uniref:Uncharacterized protein n=1 Tax=Corynascus novoguineensis TaxID=1126955 RepID=A0AAN7D1F1_9PEZI|nr:hypothetical protein C7999DRAFT_27773 [Corynascus novoguineensis]
MGLPPVTPAPSRFLASKKTSTQQSQNQTPNQQYFRGSSQFFATPRFAAVTPRPSSTQATAPTTPALALKPRVPRNRSTQDIIDDSSPVSPKNGSPSASLIGHTTLPEPIEFDSSLVPQSPFHEEAKEGRSPKRRRISIASSDTESDQVISFPKSQESDLGSLPDAPGDHIASYHSDVEDEVDEDTAAISSTQSITSTLSNHRPPAADADEASGSDDSEGEARETAIDRKSTPKTTASTKTTLSRTAPRFKLTEPPDKLSSHPDAYLAADIFSPQRRGARYLPGGLAAELRDWLVDLKGGVDGEGQVRSTSSTLQFMAGAAVGGSLVRVMVDDVSRGGVGMTLISGSVINGKREGGPDGKARVVLAGEGNIDGLRVTKNGGNIRKVAPGAVVAVAPPAWDVELDGSSWAVAYRWEVV